MNKLRVGIIAACIVLLGTGCQAPSAQPVRVPPAAEAVHLERDGDLHTQMVQEADSSFQFMLVSDHLYISQNETVEMIPLAEPEERQVVLTLEEGQIGQFLAVGDERYLDISQGGSETSARYRLLSQGQWELLPDPGAVYADHQLLLVQNEPYEAVGNLYVINGDEKTRIGSERYHYEQQNGRAGLGLLEDGIVLSGYVPSEEAYNLLLKVALPDGETAVLAEYVGSVVLDQGDIYLQRFLTEAKASALQAVLEKISGASGEVQRINLPNPYAANYGQFTVLDGLFYYQDNAYTARPLIAGAAPSEYIEQVMEQWQQSISGTGELYRLGEANTLNPQAKVRQLGRTEDYVYALFEPQNDRVVQTYPCLMVFDRTGQVVYQTKEVVTAVSIAGDLLSFTVDENYNPQSQGRIYWIWLGEK